MESLGTIKLCSESRSYLFLPWRHSNRLKIPVAICLGSWVLFLECRADCPVFSVPCAWFCDSQFVFASETPNLDLKLLPYPNPVFGLGGFQVFSPCIFVVV